MFPIQPPRSAVRIPCKWLTDAHFTSPMSQRHNNMVETQLTQEGLKCYQAWTVRQRRLPRLRRSLLTNETVQVWVTVDSLM